MASLHFPESVRSSEGSVPEEASAAERMAGGLARVVNDLLDSTTKATADLVESTTKATADLVEKTTDWVAGLAHSVGGMLSGLFGGETDGLVDDPSIPTSIPMPKPTAPTPVPVGESSPAAGFLSSGSGSYGSAPVLLIAVLALFSIALLQGKLSWLRREPLTPRAGPHLAIERPG
jgi:hypothetical protein